MKRIHKKQKIIVLLITITLFLGLGLLLNNLAFKPKPINQSDSREKPVSEIDPRQCIPFEHGGSWYEYIWVVGPKGSNCIVEVFFGKDDNDYRQQCRVDKNAGKFSTFGYSYYRDLLKKCRTIETKQHVDYEL